MAFKIHPAAEIYPLMSAAELEKLAKSIKDNGLKKPLEMYKGKILDGRNRILACEIAGVKPDHIQLSHEDIGGDPVEYVVTINDDRRNMKPWQKAITAAKMCSLKLGTNQYVEKVGTPNGAPSSRERATARVGASVTNTERALRVIRFHEKTPCKQMVDAMESGSVSLNNLDQLLSKTRSVTKIRELVAGGNEAVRDYLKPSDNGPVRPSNWVEGEELFDESIDLIKQLRSNVRKLGPPCKAGVYVARKLMRTLMNDMQKHLEETRPGGSCKKCAGKGCIACNHCGRSSILIENQKENQNGNHQKA